MTLHNNLLILDTNHLLSFYRPEAQVQQQQQPGPLDPSGGVKMCPLCRQRDVSDNNNNDLNNFDFYKFF